MIIKEILSHLESCLPLALQESYDNCGIQIGDPMQEASGALLCVDITEEVLQEAVSKGCNLVIAHHPLLFKGLKSITGKTYIERCVLFAIKQGLVIYSAHTNADNALGGLNYVLADLFGLNKVTALQPIKNTLIKLVTYVPETHAEDLRKALWDIGAGHIGGYDCCSYNVHGEGTFRAGDGTNPFMGIQGKLHTEKEVCVSLIMPSYLQPLALATLLENHPYEEPAYDIISLCNEWDGAGTGIVGELESEEDALKFIHHIKHIFQAERVCYSTLPHKKVKRVAICGGAGGSFLSAAKRAKADVYITGEAKYNDFFDAECKPTLVTVGHYESEIFATKLFNKIISDKFHNFAIHISQINSNPVNYL
ncbi:Nif3-like dinuclear metal center hexameric protein [Porphyromonas pogonae]|uniref:Nif3-like dinuclear metal center hexameric protein n=1 Tax=Porphyromonas pogonae TaxID=867595 RepID=UPI002E771DA7|nr:Nif3-like dinuclear metal center hexameric protein [Porphyromonas pogonae]